MNLKSSILLLALALPALAGPPLICHPVEIHGAKSLPWNAHAQGWDGADKSYDASTRLIPDTLALLTPLTPVSVRMETLRRASIYAARHATLAADLATKLEARANQPTATALQTFDIGYWIESVRQASFIYRYNMLSPAEKQTWQIRKGLPARDGYPLLQKAIQMGGSPEMSRALALVEEYRRSDTN
jgi:hypothetical protein